MTEAPPSGPKATEQPPEAAEGPSPSPENRLTAAHPLVVGAVLVALLAAAARALGGDAAGPTAPAPAASLPAYEVPCPSGSVADFPTAAPSGSAARAVCVPVPEPREELHLVALPDALQRRADRPEDFAKYELPLTFTRLAPDALDENAASVSDALRLSAGPGSVARSLMLEGQVEPTRAVFAGERHGLTVITAHVVPRERGTVTVLLVYGGLNGIAAELTQASLEKPVVLAAGSTVGHSEQLLFAARQLRRDVPLDEAIPKLGVDSVIATDVRNVLRASGTP